VGNDDVELSLRGLEAFNHAVATGEVEPYLEFLDDDVSYAPATAATEGITYEGKERVRTYLSGIQETWRGLQCEPVEFREVDGCLVMVGRWRASGRASGVEVDSLLVVAHQLRDGRIVWLRAFTNEDDAMRAAENRAAQSRASQDA
jgi:ketosteroid isomerase-like protein